MYESDHCALNGALEFALSKNVPICAPHELISEQAIEGGRGDYPDRERYIFDGKPIKESNDTVSAVAMDVNGYLACATSTGTCRVFSEHFVTGKTWKLCKMQIALLPPPNNCNNNNNNNNNSGSNNKGDNSSSDLMQHQMFIHSNLTALTGLIECALT